jgi:hypothetical protein
LLPIFLFHLDCQMMIIDPVAFEQVMGILVEYLGKALLVDTYILLILQQMV